MADLWIKRGDTTPAVRQTLLDAAGEGVDLFGSTVRFIMAPLRGGDPVLAVAADVLQITDGSDGSKGDVGYDWEDGDTDTAGGFNAEFEVTFAGGDIETFPNSGQMLVAIVPDLDAVAS
jgi:hypothetical protein